MKAVVVTALGGPEVLTYMDVEMPTLQPNQVLIRVIAFPKNGSYAEYVVADEALTYVLPDEGLV